MIFHTQQIQTDQGVLIGLPLSEWEKLMKEYKKFKEKEAFEKRLTAYDKSEQANVTDKELEELIKEIKNQA